MRSLLIAITGFLVGAGLIVVLVLALPQPAANPVSQPAAAAASAPSGGRAAMATMASGMGGSGAVAATATSKLTIQHVLKGCHVWSNGMTTATTMRLTLKPGSRLAILDQDVDAHQLVELSGPARLRIGGPMLMSHGSVVSFEKVGVYRLRTRTVEVPGSAAMDVKTIGPDNTLRLVVTVV